MIQIHEVALVLWIFKSGNFFLAHPVDKHIYYSIFPWRNIESGTQGTFSPDSNNDLFSILPHVFAESAMQGIYDSQEIVLLYDESGSFIDYYVQHNETKILNFLST